MNLDDNTTQEEARRVWEGATEAAQQAALQALLREARHVQAAAKLRRKQRIFDKADKLDIVAEAQVAAMILLGAENISEVVELIDKTSDALLEREPAWKRLNG